MSLEKFKCSIDIMKNAARNLGYNLVVHGSMERDFDLIAVPWVQNCSNVDSLADKLFKVSNAERWRYYHVESPHNRINFAFDWDENNFENKDYVDLSILEPLGER